jgi:P-type Mg2+ transporter
VPVLFIIRTRRNPFRSRTNPWLIACSLAVVTVAVLLPFTPVGVHLGFVAPPAFFFLALPFLLPVDLFAVEGVKSWSFRRFAPE